MPEAPRNARRGAPLCPRRGAPGPSLLGQAPSASARSVPALSGLALMVAACGGPGPAGEDELVIETETFAFALAPLLPANQSSLFQGVARVELEARDAQGASLGLWGWDAPSPGDTLSAEDLPALDGATLHLRLLDAAGQPTAGGDTAPVTAGPDGAPESTPVYVARYDDFGWLSPLDHRAFGAAVATDGAGRLLIFGGADQPQASGSSPREDATPAIVAWDPLRLEAGLQLVEVGELPDPGTGAGTAGRAGHSATRIGGTGPDAGLILVAGGASGMLDGPNATAHAFLWDPSADAVAAELELSEARFHHVAVADGAGNVVLSGGSPATDVNTYGSFLSVDFYEGTSRTVRSLPQPGSEVSWISHAAARFGDRGVLLCGGYTFSYVNLSGVRVPEGQHGDCALISPSGAYTAIRDLGLELPEPRFHHAMVGLPDGDVLVTGGMTYDPDTDSYTVHDTAWLLDAQTLTWTDVGPMHKARALHESAAMADGRVIVAGGVSASDSWFWRGDDALACAEVFTPGDGPGGNDFVEIPACLTADAAGALPEAAAAPRVVADPVLGAVVVGGLTRDDRGSTGVSIFRPTP